jgi:hypothetical protein
MHRAVPWTAVRHEDNQAPNGNVEAREGCLHVISNGRRDLEGYGQVLTLIDIVVRGRGTVGDSCDASDAHKTPRWMVATSTPVTIRRAAPMAKAGASRKLPVTMIRDAAPKLAGIFSMIA